jgi:predicted amidophosphoribosyltransferase
MASSDAFSKFSYIREYHPYRIMGGHINPAFNGADGRILDLKEGKEIGIGSAASAFIEHLSAYNLPQPIAVAIVPGHQENRSNADSPMAEVVRRMAENQPTRYTVAVDLLLRRIAIEKLARGGNRDIDTHLESIVISSKFMVRNRWILVLDDVATTGNSLMACRILLKSAGASEVITVALGKTTHD